MLVTALFAKQEIVLFSKVYSIYRAHTLVGKEKQGGLWVTQPTCGQRNCVINFKEAPQGGFDGQNRKTPKQTRSFSNPNFNHCSGTMEKGAITETSWTTETLKGKWKQMTWCQHEILPWGLPADNRSFLLFAHILALFLQQDDEHK